MSSNDEARADMHERLLAWAAWRRAGRADGYPTRSVLHPSWSPPTRGAVFVGRARPNGDDTAERELDACIASLCERLRVTLAVVYLQSMSPDLRAQALGCRESTVRARVIEAKDLLLVMRYQRQKDRIGFTR